MLPSGIIPGNFPGNNDKNALWRHNDVTWSDFGENQKERHFYVKNDTVKIWGRYFNPIGSY